MGCNSSKQKHAPLLENNAGANYPVGNAERRSVETHTVVDKQQPHVAQNDDHLDYDAFREPQLEQIDNNLWRDTQNEVAMQNIRHNEDY